MNIRIGLLTSSPGWELLLRQEGASFEAIASPEVLDADTFSVLVANEETPDRIQDALKAYVSKGGGLLTDAAAYDRFFGGSVRWRRIRYLLPERGRRFDDVGLVDICARGGIVEGSTLMKTNRLTPSIRLERYGDGVIAIVPIDFGRLALDDRRARKYFYRPSGRLPHELVSLVGKGALRKLVHACLRILHLDRGMPYCHLWYFRNDLPNAFILRVDTDFASQKEIEELFGFAERESVKLSWFLHTSAHEDWISKLAKMAGHEIGIHCYEHGELHSYNGARSDLSKAREILRDSGISPEGFAAPYGQHSSELLRVVNELGFRYSSEFSFDYDNFPSYPRLGNSWSDVLEVPIHPICIGSLANCRATASQMKEYFRSVVDWKRATYEPLFFYHHPRDGHLEILSALVEASQRNSVPAMLMGDYARWWRKRAGISYRAAVDGDNLKVGGHLPESVCLRILKDDKQALVGFSENINLPGLKWLERPRPPRLPEDLQRIRAFSFRLYRQGMQMALRKKKL